MMSGCRLFRFNFLIFSLYYIKITKTTKSIVKLDTMVTYSTDAMHSITRSNITYSNVSFNLLRAALNHNMSVFFQVISNISVGPNGTEIESLMR